MLHAELQLRTADGERGQPFQRGQERRCQPQPCSVVVERIDDGGEQKARPVVVELDELAAAFGWKMKIPRAKEADLRSFQLRNGRRLVQG